MTTVRCNQLHAILTLKNLDLTQTTNVSIIRESELLNVTAIHSLLSLAHVCGAVTQCLFGSFSIRGRKHE